MISQCEIHKQAKRYICMSPDCPLTEPICNHYQCLYKHTHNFQVKIIPITEIQQSIKKRNSGYQDRIIIAKQKIRRFFELIRQSIYEETQRKTKDTSLIDRIYLSLGNLSSESISTIDLLINQQFQKVPKHCLNQIFLKLQQNIIKDQRENQITQLDKELQRMMLNYSAKISQLLNSHEFKKIHRITLFNRSVTNRENRFQADTTSWNFDEGKIDAITFISKNEIYLAGFVHFTITTSQPIKIRVSVNEGTNQLLRFEAQFQVPHIQKEFDVMFPEPVLIQVEKKYDLISQNIGKSYKGKNGNRIKTGFLRYEKSSRDTNGTNQTSGQFKAFIYHPPM